MVLKIHSLAMEFCGRTLIGWHPVVVLQKWGQEVLLDTIKLAHTKDNPQIIGGGHIKTQNKVGANYSNYPLPHPSTDPRSSTSQQ